MLWTTACSSLALPCGCLCTQDYLTTIAPECALQDFGLYDEDPQVETPGHQEFFDSAVNSEEVWFVNFYSPGKLFHQN